MTVGTVWTDWRKEVNEKTWPRKNCPNLVTIFLEVLRERGWRNLGGYVDRPIRGGKIKSIHRYGAYDWSHPDIAERNLVIDWLIEFSHELHVSEIHDYAGTFRDLPAGHGGYWKAGRGWKPASVPSGDPNMSTPGRSKGAQWIHVENTLHGWDDTSPILSRGGGVHAPGAEHKPTITCHLWDIAPKVPADQRPWVGHSDEKRGDDVEVAGIQMRHWRTFFREVAASVAGQNIDMDGPWNLKDIGAIRNIAALGGHPHAPELIHIDTQAWQMVDFLAGMGRSGG